MKIPCSIIRDLLPLYIEKMDSEETHSLIEEHLSSCDVCKNELEKMRLPSVISVDTDIMPLKKIKTYLQKRKIITVLLTIAVTLVVVIICAGLVLAPKFIPYTDDMIQFTQNDNGVILANFKDTVADYEITSYYSQEFKGRVYYISAWDTIWNKNVTKKNGTGIALNTNSEPLASIYYSPNDGTNDILLHGENLYPNGGGRTIPHLTLAYWAVFFAIIAAILAREIFIARKNEKRLFVLLKIEYLPLAYLLAHFVVKGFNPESFILTYDLFTILVVAIPLYVLALLIEYLFRRKMSSWNIV